VTNSGIDFAEHVDSVDSGIRMLLLAVADSVQRDLAWGETAAVRAEAAEWLSSPIAEFFCDYVGMLFGRDLFPEMLRANIDKMRSSPRPMQRKSRMKLTAEQMAAKKERMKLYQKEYQANYQRESRSKRRAA
jgi:hypothetical protein